MTDTFGQHRTNLRAAHDETVARDNVAITGRPAMTGPVLRTAA
jgi:hypothetical protein